MFNHQDKIPSAFDNDFDPSRRSADSNAMLPYWDKTDNLIGGISTMRAAGTKVLPKFPKENKDDYAFRLSQTKLTNIYRDILEGLSSKPFEEEITFVDETKTPQEIIDFAENVDGAGNNLTKFSSEIFFNGLNSAIDWIFVDYPNVAVDTVKTKRDQKQLGLRPFWSRVLARNVLDAQIDVSTGEETLTLIRFLEPGTPNQIREFIKFDEVVSWFLYEQNSEKKWIEIESGTLTIDVIPLVPFYTGKRDGKTFKFLPSMLEAVDLQIDLFEQESALKFAKVMAAFPMLAGNGVTPERGADGTPNKIAIGPMKVLYAPMDGSGKAGSWQFIEPSATSLKFLADDIKETKADLREIGRQPLTAQSGNVTVITSAVAAGKSKSAVVAWALNLKDALENALAITGKWLNQNDYKPQINVYTEFDEFLDLGADLDALAKARDNKDLSQRTYWYELQRRKVLSPEFNADDEIEAILKEEPTDSFDDDETA